MKPDYSKDRTTGDNLELYNDEYHRKYSAMAMELYGRRYRMRIAPVNWGVMQGHLVRSWGYFIISGKVGDTGRIQSVLGRDTHKRPY